MSSAPNTEAGSVCEGPVVLEGRDRSVQACFEQVARDRWDAVAVGDDEGRLTYGQLAGEADRIAGHLAARGVEPGACVGVCLERSVRAVVAILGVLKAGAAYLPLDPRYPRERLSFMLRDAAPAVVIVDGRSRGIEHPRLVDIEAEGPQIAALPAAAHSTNGHGEDRAYVMYTSGSTGEPKGVEVLHRGITRLVRQVTYARLTPDTVMLHAAPLSFDASTFEIWGALLNGGRCVVHAEAVPSARGLADAISRHGVSTAWLTAALFNSIVDEDVRALSGLKELLVGGESLSVGHVRRVLEELPDLQIVNGYGPTEATTFTCCHRVARPIPAGARSIPIGRPIRDTRVVLLDEERAAVPLGEIGEICIGGDGLARGYLRRPELTSERFVPDPFRPGERLYRTGDLARVLPDGAIDFVGRNDRQVKVRGYRIELGEIESALARHHAVKSCVALVRDAGGDKRIVAYVVARGERVPVSDLRRWAAGDLPPFMVPSSFVWIDAVPLTQNGKLDERALPAASVERPDVAPFVAPASERERKVCAVWSEILGVVPVGVLDNVFDLGATSLTAVRAAARLRTELGLDSTVVDVFARPTPRGFVEALEGRVAAARVARASAGVPEEERAVAIVGMAGRFPGAASVNELERLVWQGREGVRFFRPDEIDPSIPASVREDPRYVRARGVLEEVEGFDAAFFGVSPKEAEIMDPQQRVLLELAWQALEEAGHVPERFEGRIGVFAGKYNDTYWSENVVHRRDLIEAVGAFQAMIANEKDYVATRIAHKLDLKGPAISVHTACSTSLVAVAQAVRSLRAGECDLALAGGASITVPVRSGHLYQEGAMLSKDGHTWSFGRGATGTVFSDGAAVVVLRRLSDALREGDTIYAVVRGVAVNNDGAGKASFTAPSVDGQAAAVRMAHADAGVAARSIGYVEAHGTATPLGDPIEIAALTQAFRAETSDVGFCAIGSIKSNIGHTVIAAGVAGLIKAALALARGEIPPTLYGGAQNPRIDFATSPFVLSAELRPWPRGATARRAGVSSFGVGGTNAHVVLEEAPVRPSAAPSQSPQLLLLSARSGEALDALAQALAARLTEMADVSMEDVAFTLLEGRRHFPARRAVVASDAATAAAALRSPRAPVVAATEPNVVFLFPGQGSQYPGMGRALYASEPVFRGQVDLCAEACRGPLGCDLRELLHPTRGQPQEWSGRLRDTRYAQPALFTVELALARLLESWGVRPDAMVGHSVGEFVCAVLAGVMRTEDALSAVVARGKWMSELPEGDMLSVRAPAGVVAKRLPAGTAIASDNAPSLCVVSGPKESVALLRAQLEADGIACKPLRTSHAFHSPMMDPVVEPFTRRMASVELSSPRASIVSTLTGRLITDVEARDPSYWGRHLREPVRFASAVAVLAERPGTVMLEVGPGATLATLVRQQLRDRARHVAIATLSEDSPDERASLLSALGQAWTHGVALDARAMHRGGSRRRVSLPTYPFERTRHWVDPKPRPLASGGAQSVVNGAARAAAQEGDIVTVERPSRGARLSSDLRQIFESASGIEIGENEIDRSFVELGLDSLFLTQAALSVQKKTGVKVSFRQLVEELTTVRRLAEHLDRALPPEDAAPPATTHLSDRLSRAPVASGAESEPKTPAAKGSVAWLIEQQLDLMSKQLTALQACTPSAAPQPTVIVSAAPEPADKPAVPPKPFGAMARISLERAGASPKQRARLEALTRRYAARTKASKEWTQRSRATMADPRVVTGFRPAIKELVYPIVVQRSSGARLWDLDGNEYIDCLNGFGCNLFGWQPEFVTRAIERQLQTGHEIGPQTPLAGECATLVCELTGFDRAAFCNTGSEAVMGALRIARTVTGRSKIAIFSGSYHGIFDEVIVRGTKRGTAVPAAPGILPSTAENVMVTEYGAEASIAALRAQAGELAAILVEPVQSRRPELQPREFLHQLRKLTEEAGIALIFDEVITGFRTSPGGAQEYFGVRADLASYGKVIGGGLPVGVIAGKRAFMDALDGGHWQFGDDSVPTVGVTYFAGTFVRHPLALAAVKAVLTHLKSAGPDLQRDTNAKAERLARELNAFFSAAGAPIAIRHFGSLWRTVFTSDQPWADLLFVLLRDRGIHILDGFPCFFTTAHTAADVEVIVEAFKAAVLEMQESGFLPEGRPKPEATGMALDASRPPLPGARLGRDSDGRAAWFVPNPNEPGKYLKLESGS